VELDRTDITLLKLLERDANTTVKRLSSEVGLAMSSTHDRLKALRRDGILKGSHAEIDEKAFGIHIQALLHIVLAKQRRETVDGLIEDLSELACVRAIFHVTGRYDFVVHVLAHDMKQLKLVELSHFTSHRAIARVETSIIFDARQRFETPFFESQ
jgi:DNA-binding Lrp family transcriptional regulator